MRPKTARRLLLLGVLAFLVIAGGVAFVAVRKWQNTRVVDGLRADGIVAYDRKDYAQALGKLGPYLKRNPDDHDVLVRYAKARELVEDANFGHLPQAIKAYEQCLLQDPSDKVMAAHLVTLYTQCGLFNEARDRAAKLHPADLDKCTAEHRDVLVGEARARIAIKASDPRIGELLKRALELEPADVVSQAQYGRWLRDVGRAADVPAYVDKLRKNFPNESWAKVAIAVMALEESVSAENSKAVFVSVSEMCGIDIETGKRVGPSKLGKTLSAVQAVALFDLASRFSNSISILREECGDKPDSDLFPIYLRRLWYFGQNDEIVARLPKPMDLSPSGAHTELIVFAYLTSRDKKHNMDVAPLIAALEKRPDDFRSRAWLSILKMGEQSPQPTPAQEIVALREAIKEHPAEPILSHLLASRLADLGRQDESRTLWASATRMALCTGWSMPWSRVADSYLNEGRAESALEAATNAVRIDPNGFSGTVTWINAQIACVESGIPVPGGEGLVLDRVDQLIAANTSNTETGIRAFFDSLIPGRVLLLSRKGQKEDAKRLVSEAIARQPALPGKVLQHLASVCAKEKLGSEEQVLSLNEKSHGVDANMLVVRAQNLHQNGKSAEGAALLRAAVKEHAATKDPSWRMGLAYYLEGTGAADAKDEWVALADAFPESLSVQMAALRATSLAADLAVIERVSERVTKLTGADDAKSLAPVRLARARALLSGPPSARARDEAVGILKDLAVETPDLPDVRRLLVSGLLLEDEKAGLKADLRGAIEQLKSLATKSQDKTGVTLDMARLLQRSRDFSASKSELIKVTTDVSASSTAREEAADLLAAQGDFADAVPVFEKIVADVGPNNANPFLLLRLAAVYRSNMRDADATAIYRRLVARGLTQGEHVLQTALGLAATGDLPGAQKLMATLDSLDLAPGKREVLKGSYAQERGETAEAIVQMSKATELAPDNAEAWFSLTSLHLRAGDRDKAGQVLAKAMAQLPNEPRLRVLKTQLSLGTTSEQIGDLGAVAKAMADDPNLRARAEVVRVLDEMKQSGKLNDIDAWQALAARFSSDVTVQTAVTQAMVQMSPPRIDAAAVLAKRTMSNFPSEPEAARIATFVYRRMGNWSDMAAAARVWQQLTRARDADLAIAEASIALSTPKTAIDQLRSHIAGAVAAPAAPGSLSILNLQARGLVLNGQVREASDLLQPLLASAAEVRNKVWLPIAGVLIQADTDAKSWIERAEPLSSVDSVDDQLALADAWSQAGLRLGKLHQIGLERSTAILKRLVANPKGNTAIVHFALGSVLESYGDQKAAVEPYRKAVELDPKSIASLDGLAKCLAVTSTDRTETVEEAIGIVTNAIQLAGFPAPQLLRTRGICEESLARVKKAKGDTNGSMDALMKAVGTYRALSDAKSATTADFLLLARVQEAVQDFRGAAATYERCIGRGGPLSKIDQAGLQNNFAYMLFRADKSPANLKKARDLVATAIDGISDRAYICAFSDTLGQIELARGERTAAIAAFRKGIGADPSSAACSIGLAEVYASGNSEEVAEGKKVLASILSKPASISALDPETSKRFDDVKKKLGL